MVPIFFKRITLFLLLTTSLLTVNAQSQEDFNTRLSDVYTNAADKKMEKIIVLILLKKNS